MDKQASKPTKATKRIALTEHTWRVVLAVQANEKGSADAQKHVSHTVRAATMRRAAKAARIAQRKDKLHATLAVLACIREDASEFAVRT